jgi:hypothetical protein
VGKENLAKLLLKAYQAAGRAALERATGGAGEEEDTSKKSSA